MKISISPVSNSPAYEQIMNQIREQVLEGQLESDVMLPSIRGLARELKVGIITVKRAYDELCQEGILYSVAGKGIFVSPLDQKKVQSVNKELVREQLMDIIEFARERQISKEEIIEMIKGEKK